MKKILSFLLLLGLIFTGSSALGVSSCTQTIACTGDGYACTLTFDWTAHTDGSFTSTAVESAKLGTLKNYFVYLMKTDPGTPAPTANYDMTLTDTNGLDVAGGQLANRAAATTEQVMPKIDSANGIFGGAPLTDAATLAITGNSANGAKGKLILFLVRN